MDKITRIGKLWLPVILWAGAIFLLSSKPVQPASEIYWKDFLIKKTFHVLEYGFLFILAYRATINSSNLSVKRVAILSLILIILYAVTDEYHQTFVFGRTGKIRDVLIDTAGGLLGWWTLWKYLPKAPVKLKSWAKKLQIV